jgi:hypothetical protein
MRLNFKLVCIFIIAIYCLSPLAAVDFSHNNDTNCIDQEDDDSIAVTDVDVAADDDENKDIDDVAADANIEDDVDKDVDAEDEKDTRLNPNIRVSCIDEDPVEGDVTFLVEADYGMTGFYRMMIDGHVIKGELCHGKDKITVGGVPAGKHTVQVLYTGSNDFLPSSTEMTFTVNNLPDPNLNINLAGDVYEGDDVKFDITAKDTFSGNVIIKLNNSDDVYDVSVVNGHATASIGDLDAGKYSATVSFVGDKHFRASEKTVNFAVHEKGKVNPKLSLNVNNGVEGQNIPAEISADKKFEGDVTLKVLGTDKVYNVHVKDGKTTQDITGLTAGKYDVIVYFHGNENYTSSKAKAAFEVESGLMDPQLSANVKDVMEGESAVVQITADETFSGDVKVTVINSGTEYTAEVVDGAGNVTIDGLNPGIYAVKVSFDGDDTFKASEKTAVFSVKYIKLDTNLTIKCTDENPVEGQTAHILVTSDYMVSGRLYFTVDDDYTFESYMYSGRCNVPIDGFTAGEHEIKVQYYGGDQFTPSTATMTFTVNSR